MDDRRTPETHDLQTTTNHTAPNNQQNTFKLNKQYSFNGSLFHGLQIITERNQFTVGPHAVHGVPKISLFIVAITLSTASQLS